MRAVLPKLEKLAKGIIKNYKTNDFTDVMNCNEIKYFEKKYNIKVVINYFGVLLLHTKGLIYRVQISNKFKIYADCVVNF